jgi:hypothetical protein
MNCPKVLAIPARPTRERQVIRRLKSSIAIRSRLAPALSQIILARNVKPVANFARVYSYALRDKIDFSLSVWSMTGYENALY